jgi:antiphage defense system Thoeris ThsB-like protein
MAKGKDCDIGLDDRCRDLDGEIRQKRGDALHALSAVSAPSLTGLLSGYRPLSPQLPTTGLVKALSAPAVKRKVYFAFRFKDIMRVNNVRQSGKIGFDEDKNPRDFYDRSIWEKRAIEDPESLKRLMREGVEHSSAVCVLVGSDTWQSKWVKYEIARAVIDKKGLLPVGINSLAHVHSRISHSAGINPLAVMGVYKGTNGSFYLAENCWVPNVSNALQYEWRWFIYEDYKFPVPLPPYLVEKPNSNVSALSEGARLYDYVANDGLNKLGSWIDFAAKQVGR